MPQAVQTQQISQSFRSGWDTRKYGSLNHAQVGEILSVVKRVMMAAPGRGRFTAFASNWKVLEKSTRSVPSKCVMVLSRCFIAFTACLHM